MDSINLAYINAKNKKNTVVACTSIDEFKKLSSENMYFTKYGDGFKYWKNFTENVVIGATDIDSINRGKIADIPSSIEQYIYNSSLIEIGVVKKRILNTTDIEWEFESVNELKNLKEFLSNTYNQMIHVILNNAEVAFKDHYNIDLKQADISKGLDFYEKRVNRLVINYSIIGIDIATNDPLLYTVQWYDKESLKYIEEIKDKYIQISDYAVVIANE